MGKFPALMIILASSLLFHQNLKVVNGAKCFGSLASNSSYAQNRRDLFSTLANNVSTNSGFYNASLGQYPNIVYALGFCEKYYEQKACLRCLESLTLDTQTSCGHITNSFVWSSDDEDRFWCLVRSSNQSFGNLELIPPLIEADPDHIGQSIDMNLFMQQWESTVNMTLEAATKADNSSSHKYYSVVKAEFTDYPNVYMMMQCTPDITSQDCKHCLGDCVEYFREQFRGRKGGMASLPSCLFRWDLDSFHSAFGNVTRFPVIHRPQAPEKGSSIPDKKGKIIAIVVVPTVINLLVLLGLIRAYRQIKKSKDETSVWTEEDCISDSQFMLRFDLSMVLLATGDFSPENKIGQGGFGSVYKGVLPNGQEIAVKRLTRGSGQGDIEFRNEVLLLTRLQHRNLVKLLGFCNEGDEEILVYEFVPNSSLDNFIFDEAKRCLLTWDVRYRIIEGVARGLLYLHEDSQLRIIHRDLKASNILLDAEMNPKVADFGMARLFNMDQTRGQTSRVVGTYGYMAPEYATYGLFSAKSDVYSFGVMLLEMISGKRNKNLKEEEEEEEEEGLLDFVWKNWSEGKYAEIIDPLSAPSNNISVDQVMKLIHIGLLCVQEDVSKRPTINIILIWLESHAATVMPVPTPVTFLTAPSSPSSSLHG
ncbi:hypothetical protein Bca52824_002586 [Brassica carinata]|uniref:Uncharacterized protein n=1 Tax=Brassica carinata TaxID=52824 RepID=A0A8X7WKJ7_BRACI|nr:hypothetical protein Bca52824_002586 [Brassica carinata]